MYILRARGISVKDNSQVKPPPEREKPGSFPQKPTRFVLYSKTMALPAQTCRGRESSSWIQSSTWTTEYYRWVLRMTTRVMPALMMTRRHMEQEVASWRRLPSLASRPAR